MTTVSFCDGCGWQVSIVKEHSKGRRSFNLCKTCVDLMASRRWDGLDIQKRLEAFLGGPKVPEVPLPDQGTIRDPNAKVAPLFDVRPVADQTLAQVRAKKVPNPMPPNENGLWFLLGILLGIALGAILVVSVVTFA